MHIKQFLFHLKRWNLPCLDYGEIEDYFHKKGDCDGSIWTEQGIINYIYEKINQLIKD